MENERLNMLISLTGQIRIEIADAISDITSSFEDSESRTRIITNLEKIQKAVFSIPRDLNKGEFPEIVE